MVIVMTTTASNNNNVPLYLAIRSCVVLCTEAVHSHKHTWRAVLTVLWVGFCHTGPISLCVDLFVFICVYFVCFCFILRSCCIIVNTAGWT